MGLTLNTGQLSDIITYSNGNIGIGGAASGSYKLQVTGTTNLTGKLTGANAALSANVSGDVAVEIVNTNSKY